MVYPREIFVYVEIPAVSTTFYSVADTKVSLSLKVQSNEVGVKRVSTAFHSEIAAWPRLCRLSGNLYTVNYSNFQAVTTQLARRSRDVSRDLPPG